MTRAHPQARHDFSVVWGRGAIQPGPMRGASRAFLATVFCIFVLLGARRPAVGACNWNSVCGPIISGAPGRKAGFLFSPLPSPRPDWVSGGAGVVGARASIVLSSVGLPTACAGSCSPIRSGGLRPRRNVRAVPYSRDVFLVCWCWPTCLAFSGAGVGAHPPLLPARKGGFGGDRVGVAGLGRRRGGGSLRRSGAAVCHGCVVIVSGCPSGLRCGIPTRPSVFMLLAAGGFGFVFGFRDTPVFLFAVMFVCARLGKTLALGKCHGHIPCISLALLGPGPRKIFLFLFMAWLASWPRFVFLSRPRGWGCILRRGLREPVPQTLVPGRVACCGCLARTLRTSRRLRVFKGCAPMSGVKQ